MTNVIPMGKEIVVNKTQTYDNKKVRSVFRRLAEASDDLNDICIKYPEECSRYIGTIYAVSEVLKHCTKRMGKF